MKDYVEILKKCVLFNGIDEKDFNVTLGCLSAKTRSYHKSAPVMSVGDKTQYIGLMLKGSALISKDDFKGNRTVLSEIAEGQIFGEAYAASGNPISVNVTAETDCVIMFLDINKMLTVYSSACAFHAVLIRNLIILFAQKNVILSNKIEHISHRRLRDKILSYLFDYSQKSSTGSIEIPFNRQQLADYLCADRSALSFELCKLRDEGVIEFNKNKFKLL